ncbi:MAG: hypothetical protein IJS96_07475 [Schwartzia sp.]|nr:hypothetical protein [Schwartzia sp. (in: firmicutes)]
MILSGRHASMTATGATNKLTQCIPNSANLVLAATGAMPLSLCISWVGGNQRNAWQKIKTKNFLILIFYPRFSDGTQPMRNMV